MKAELKLENIHPSELNVGDTVEVNGQLKTVGAETVKVSFFGVTVDGIKVKEINRVLFPKWFKGQVIGYQAQI